MHALDTDIRWPPVETPGAANASPSSEDEADASIYARNPTLGALGGDGGGFRGFGSNLLERFKNKLMSQAMDKVKGFVKRNWRVARQKLRGKRASTEHLPPPEEVLGVTLYEKRDYQGNYQSFSQDVATLKGQPLGHDYARSVKVDPGCIVTLYEEDDYQGRSTQLRLDTPVLKDTEVGADEVTSLKVRCR